MAMATYLLISSQFSVVSNVWPLSLLNVVNQPMDHGSRMCCRNAKVQIYAVLNLGSFCHFMALQHILFFFFFLS